MARWLCKSLFLYRFLLSYLPTSFLERSLVDQGKVGKLKEIPTVLTISPSTQSQATLQSKISRVRGERGCGQLSATPSFTGERKTCFPVGMAQSALGWLCCKMSPKLWQVPG